MSLGIEGFTPLFNEPTSFTKKIYRALVVDTGKGKDQDVVQGVEFEGVKRKKKKKSTPRGDNGSRPTKKKKRKNATVRRTDGGRCKDSKGT